MEESKVLSAYEKVQIVRDNNRPKIDDYINALFHDLWN